MQQQPTRPTKTPTPCAFDLRRLRITLFPEHPQTILIYVPPGQSLWLPTLPTPFDLDAVCNALDSHDVPHDTKEGDRNRWWRNLKQSEDEEKSEQTQRQLEEAAAKRVQIHLSSAATTFDKQRAEIVSMKLKVDDEIRQLKVQIDKVKADAAATGIYEAPKVFHDRKQRLADLQTASIALQKKLGDLKARRMESREQRFIEKMKQHLPHDQFVAVWAEVDEELANGPQQPQESL